MFSWPRASSTACEQVRSRLSVPRYDRRQGDLGGLKHAYVPLLTAAQWRKIATILPENRRDPLVISAILFREHSGEPIRAVASTGCRGFA